MSQELSEKPQSRSEEENGADSNGWFLAVLPVAVVAACAELGIAILNNSALPVYYHFGLGISIKLLPLIWVPFFISEALFKLPLGHLSDRFGRKPLIVVGVLVTVFTPQVLVHIHSIPGQIGVSILLLLAFLRLIDGLGGAATWPSVYSYVGDYVKENKRGAAMGLLNSVYMSATAVSFLVGGLVDDYFGPIFTGGSTLGREVRVISHRVRQVGRHFRDTIGHHPHPAPMPFPIPQVPGGMDMAGHYFPSFIASSILFAVAAVVSLLMLKGKAPRSQNGGAHVEEDHSWGGFMVAVKSVPQFITLAFVVFVGIGCIAPLIKIFAIDEFRMTEREVGVMTLWPALMIAAVALPIGHLADRWGKALSVRLGFLLCAVGLWGIPVLHAMHQSHPIGFIISATVTGLGSTMAFPSWMALLTTLCNDHQRGTVIGAVSTGQGIGILVGVLIGPQLYADFGHIAPFATAAALVTIGLIMALVFVRDRPMCETPATA